MGGVSGGPAGVRGVRGGSLAPGAAADITILDLQRPFAVAPPAFRSRSRNTPFRGWTGTGAPVMTVVGGSVVTP